MRGISNKTKNRVSRAKELFDDGYSFVHIAQMLGTTGTTVRTWLDHAYRERRNESTRQRRREKAKNSRVKRRGTNWTEKRKQQARDLRAEGLTLQQVAERMGVSRRNVSYALQACETETLKAKAEGVVNYKAENGPAVPKVVILEDSRSLTGKLCGDPLPCRSARSQARYEPTKRTAPPLVPYKSEHDKRGHNTLSVGTFL